MSSLKRGLRNLGRNRSRNLLIALIIGLSAALALVVFAVENGINRELAAIESEVGTLIEIRPVGGFGLISGESLDTAILDEIQYIEGINRITPYLTCPLPLDRELFEWGGNPDENQPGRGMGAMMRFFVFGMGVGEETGLYYGGGAASLVTGRNLERSDEGQGVAVIGRTLAEHFGLTVGSRLPLEEGQEPVTVVGIYESTSRMLERGAFMPFESVQRFWGEGGRMHQVIVEAESLAGVDRIAGELRLLLGDEVDITAQKDTATGRLQERIASMQSVLRLVLILSLIMVGVVVLATMFLTARERSGEIGILKALGAFRKDIVVQFGIESLFLSLAGFLSALCIYFLGGNGMASLITRLGSRETSGMPAGTPQMMERARGMMFEGRGFLNTSLEIGTIEAVLSPGILLFVLGAILALGLLGGILPGWYASHFKPAEVLRRG